MIAKILVADDSQEIGTLLKEYLSARGHAVIVVTDGYQLVEAAQKNQPHLIIADILMPSAYGSSAYQILQKDKATAAIPFLFVSAHPFEKVRGILPNDSKTRFLPKPISFEDLDKRMAELLPLGGFVP